MKMPGRDDQGFVDISAIALNAAINGSIFAEPVVCFVICALVRGFDCCEFDHFPPFLDIVGNQLAKVGRGPA